MYLHSPHTTHTTHMYTHVPILANPNRLYKQVGVFNLGLDIHLDRFGPLVVRKALGDGLLSLFGGHGCDSVLQNSPLQLATVLWQQRGKLPENLRPACTPGRRKRGT